MYLLIALIGTGDGIMAVLGDRPQIGAGRAWRAVRVQNVVIDLGAVAFVGIGVVVGYWWVVSWLAMPTALGVAGLVLVLTWLAIGVHVHGWVTAFDAPTASWIGNSVHRSP